MADSAAITLSLISHTNVGKTTLARTLLGRDVGEVRDAAHVTIDATRYTMIETLEGDSLELWDTPGFGDSVRLSRRLAQHGNPIGWFLTQVWDRFRDRPLWLAQQAVRNVRDEADVVLYLVNASERPSEAGYVTPELDVLTWIGKPVIVLLNQTGDPRPRDVEEAEEMQWRQALAPFRLIASLLTLDAFARCWVQELTLLRAVTLALPTDRREAGARLANAWQARRWEQFRASMHALAQAIARAAGDRVTLAAPDAPMGTMRAIKRALGIDRASANEAKKRAMLTLAQRAQQEMRASTDMLIVIHGLVGHAVVDVLERLASRVTASEPLHEGKAAMYGGVLSGALSGLAADVASGGLTLGAGMVAGGLLGALGGVGLARGYNAVRGTSGTMLRWSDEFLYELIDAALLRYLAVAHYGRGRGEWQQTEYPAFWRELVAAVTTARRSAFSAAWSDRFNRTPDSMTPQLCNALEGATIEILHRLYPDAPREGASAS